MARICKEDGTSINQFVSTAVAERVSAMKTTEFFAAHAADVDIDAALRLLQRAGGQPPEPYDRLEGDPGSEQTADSIPTQSM